VDTLWLALITLLAMAASPAMILGSLTSVVPIVSVVTVTAFRISIAVSVVVTGISMTVPMIMAKQRTQY
jgi:hypothetical protein